MTEDKLVVECIVHANQEEAVKHFLSFQDDYTIFIDGMYRSVSPATAEKMAAADVPFAYLAIENDKFVLIPINGWESS